MNRGMIAALVGCLLSTMARAEESSPPDFNTSVAPLLAKYCNGCHNEADAEGKLILESYDQLLAGGRRGPAIVPGRSDQSRLVLVLEGRAKPVMPPEGNEAPNAQEISTIKAWIDAGAKSPSGAPPDPTKLVTPHVPLRVERPRLPIHSATFSPDGKHFALASYGRVRVLNATSLATTAELSDLRGHVNELAFSSDGRRILTAAGEPGLFGEVQVWEVGQQKPERSIVGHRDALYCLAVIGEGKWIATGSYDEQVRLWDVASGSEARLMVGHNGPVFGLSASPDGRLLASASGDRTVKIWDVATGERLDTLNQSLKELYTVAFSPDGKRLVAGGMDNRIRLWRIGKSAREGENPLIDSRFAHEGAIVRLTWSKDGRWLASSAEDRTVKIWDADSLVERHLLERQSDTPAALAFSPDGKQLLVGRLDGSFTLYDVTSGQPRASAGQGSLTDMPKKPVVEVALQGDATRVQARLTGQKESPSAKPELIAVEPRGVQRGVATKLLITGKQLQHATSVSTNHPKLTARLLADPVATPTRLAVELVTADDTKPGKYELSVTTPGGASGKLNLWVDDLPQQAEAEPNGDPSSGTAIALPVSCWGTLAAQGDTDHFGLEASAGQTIVFDLSAQSLGSKLNGVLTLFDSDGRVVAANNDFDGHNDPLLAYTVPTAGRYTIRVSDLLLAGSSGHFYRLSVGSFPYVTACFPLGVPANCQTRVELVGFNLPAGASAQVQADSAGEAEVPIELPGARSRGPLKVTIGALAESLEMEPNDAAQQATPIAAPGTVNGRIDAHDPLGADVDLFRFEAQQGEQWIVETEAARRGSPLDTRIEVLDEHGQPIERMLLQATRDSYITFRGIDSQTIDVRVTNWEEMELNELLYMQGEVCQLFRLPQGPDSGFNFYARGGKRRSLFDTSPTTHALDEPCYTVVPHPPGTKLVPNGLPVFPLYYANDDEGDRKLGSDSRLTFTAPRSGAYLVSVSDVRQQGGDRHAYRLTVRRPKPDFDVALGGANPTLAAGSGKGFTLTADRRDGFEGEISIIIDGLPPGFAVSQPLSIQAGHLEAKGVLWASADAAPPTEAQWKGINIVARATIADATVPKPVNGFGKITLEDKPTVTVHLEPAELVIAPGETISATLRVERNGFEERVQFAVDNLPHGVIVDNIGLNGVLIPAGQSQRQIFLTARNWVPETTRPFHAVANNAAAQASRPVTLKVRRTAEVAHSNAPAHDPEQEEQK